MMSAVTSSLGTSQPPSAVRAGRPTWRDPRLWVGVAIVAGSLLVGARVLGQAEESVAVWAAREELAAGATLDPAAVVARQVRFVDPADLDLYLPADVRLVHGLGAGELVARSAVSAADDTGLLTVPISVPALAVPPDLAAGSHVDVWVTLESATGQTRSRPLLVDVVVIAAPAPDDSFGVSGDRQLVLGVDESQGEELGRTLAAVGESAITVVGRG
jgi:hypothetical protein